MKPLIASVCFTVVGTISVLTASDRTSVTITGCVQQGDTSNTYVLTNLAETSPRAQNPAHDIYWLTSTTGLHAQVGHKVQVTGLVSEDAGQTGKIKVKTAANGDETLAIEASGKKAEIKVDAPDGVSGEKSKSEVSKPAHTMHVQSIKMLAPSCT
jgi:hypothetical protein